MHRATLLPNGKVLVAGGFGNGGYLASAELYDPLSGTWTASGSLGTKRADHTATVLPNGKVLVVGGVYDTYLASAELYDPASGTWTATSSLVTERSNHTATLLLNGKVLVAGGFNNFDWERTAELYDVGLGFHKAAQPKIATARFTSRAHRLQLTGSLLQGISQASGG